MSPESPTGREHAAEEQGGEAMEQFRFEPGKLYIRRQGGDELFQFEMSDQQWHMRSVAEIRDGKAGASHGSAVEGLHEQSGYSGSGNFIEHVPATDDDLKRFMRAYEQPHVPLQEWVNDTCNARDLDEAEKARIRRIAAEIEAEKQSK